MHCLFFFFGTEIIANIGYLVSLYIDIYLHYAKFCTAEILTKIIYRLFVLLLFLLGNVFKLKRSLKWQVNKLFQIRILHF